MKRSPVQNSIIAYINKTNWIIFCLINICGFSFMSFDFGMGVLFGGLIVTINFFFLEKTLKKAFTPPYISTHNMVLTKYYIRFIISGVIIFLLIAGDVVSPIGLIVGLSVVVISIVCATMREVKKLIFKEAV
jgi:hypothetical protein